MALETVKSPSVANLDAVPKVVNTTGAGAQGRLRSIDGSAVAIALSNIGSTYQLVRIPFTAKVKNITFESAAQTVGVFDLGVYYATDGSNGGQHPNVLVAVDAIDDDFFATDIDAGSAVPRTDVTNESGSYTINERSLPLWQALGLPADPGGNADIVATVSTAVTTGTGVFGITVDYVD